MEKLMTKPKVNVDLNKYELLVLVGALSEVYTKLCKSSTKSGRDTLEALTDKLLEKLAEIKQSINK
jgi:hypothetical protein